MVQSHNQRGVVEDCGHIFTVEQLFVDTQNKNIQNMWSATTTKEQ